MMTIGCVRMMSITVSAPNFDRRYVQMTASSWWLHTSLTRDSNSTRSSICDHFDRPVHPATNSAERESSLGVTAGQLLEHFKHPVLIKATVPEVSFGVCQQLELPAFLSGRGVNSRTHQPSQVVLPLAWIYDVNRFVAALEPSLINGSSTRYSSSSLLKNAQTWRKSLS